MGLVMNKVREGISDYLKSPEAEDFHKIPGSEKIVELLGDDRFLQALMEGSKEIDSSFVGNPTKEGLSGIIDRINDVAEQYGGSYEALAKAYEKNPDAVLDALKNNDMDALAVLFEENQLIEIMPESMMFAAVDSEMDRNPFSEEPEEPALDIADMQGGYLLSSDGGAVAEELIAGMGMDPQGMNLFNATDGTPFGGNVPEDVGNSGPTNDSLLVASV